MQKIIISNPFRQLFAGLKAEAPLLVGVFPFAMIYGALAVDAGIPAGTAQAMSAVVFAGSSQLVATHLIGTSTPALLTVLTIAVVNLRHALYSASVSPYINKLSPVWKSILAYLLTDEAYAVTIINYNKALPEQKDPHWFFLGAGLGLWSTWQAGTAVGIKLGAIVPSNWSLDFTLSLTFIALVIPVLKDRPSLAAALSAGTLAVITHPLPYNLWIIIAAIGGIITGLWLEARQ
jgi:4-azaleucine resistance transporter AzlC